MHTTPAAARRRRATDTTVPWIPAPQSLPAKALATYALATYALAQAVATGTAGSPVGR